MEDLVLNSNNLYKYKFRKHEKNPLLINLKKLTQQLLFLDILCLSVWDFQPTW